MLSVVNTLCSPRAPFDVSLIVLVVMMICTVCLWTENYGDKSVEHVQCYKNAINTVRSGR